MHLEVLLCGAVFFWPYAVLAQCPVTCVCEDSDVGKMVTCSNLNLAKVILQGNNDSFTMLDISFNKIAFLENRVFQKNTSEELIYLNISHNVIDEIDDEAFVLLTNLKILDLSHNNISSLPSSLFEPLFESLEELYLNDNPLSVLSQGLNLRNIRILDLANCQLKTFPNTFFEYLKTITYLNLESNEVKRSENLADLSQLTNLIRLNLKLNKMQELERNLLRINEKVSIDLAGNPWMCNCNFLHNMFYAYKERDYSPDLVCAFPEDLRGQTVSTELADQRCNTVTLEEDVISVANVLVPLIIVGTTIVIFIVFVIFERKWKCFDCSGNRYEIANRKANFNL